MKLISNHLIVQRWRSPQLPGSSIVLPPILQDDYNTGGPKEYRVLAVGPGRLNRKGVRLPIECQAGDHVICHSYTTGATELDDGRMIITDDMIMCVIPKLT